MPIKKFNKREPIEEEESEEEELEEVEELEEEPEEEMKQIKKAVSKPALTTKPKGSTERFEIKEVVTQTTPAPVDMINDKPIGEVEFRTLVLNYLEEIKQSVA